MDYVSALVPPVVMAAFFIGLVVTIVKSQGGPNKAKEDAAVDAAISRAESAQQAPHAAWGLTSGSRASRAPHAYEGRTAPESRAPFAV